MSDWATVASLATAGGTLVLAVATFGSVRSANRTARVAEQSLLASVRPLVMPSRPDDPAQKVAFADNHWVRVPGGGGTIEVTDEAIYLTMSLRNAGTGIAVLDGWRLEPGDDPAAAARPPLDAFRRLSRDLYIPAGDLYFWMGAIREPEDPDRAELVAKVAAGTRVTVDLLYGDEHGGQRVVARFLLRRHADATYGVALSRQWNVDRPDPR